MEILTCKYCKKEIRSTRFKCPYCNMKNRPPVKYQVGDKVITLKGMN